MDKTEVILSNEAFSVELPKANKYGKLPAELKRYFEIKNWQVDKNADVIKPPKYGEWYIFDYAPHQIELFKLTFKRQNKFNELVLERITPSYNGNNPHLYPMFEVGISFKKDQSLFISGNEREELESKGADRKLKKWDYFFLPSKEALVGGHNQIINLLTLVQEEFEAQQKNSGIKVGAFFLAILIGFNFLWAWLVLILGLYAAYRLRALFLTFFNCFNSIKVLKSAVEKVQVEKDGLLAHSNQTKEKAETITGWLAAEIDALDIKAAEELGLPNELIDRPDKRAKEDIEIPEHEKIIGLRIVEWGLTQPIAANGKREIEKKYWYHLRALRWYKQEPILGVYYLTFIYLTRENINFCGFFYDFIQERSYGTYTKQIHYRDIVTIGAREESISILSDVEELQVKKIVIENKSGSSVSIALTDKVAIENISEQIQKRANQYAELDSPDDLEAHLENNDNWLPSTRANYVISNLRTYWNKKKILDNLPPQGDSRYLS